jgi:hypothetical protein
MLAATNANSQRRLRRRLTHVVTAEACDAVRVVLRDEHRRLVTLVDVWMRNAGLNLVRARLLPPPGFRTDRRVSGPKLAGHVLGNATEAVARNQRFAKPRADPKTS